MLPLVSIIEQLQQAVAARLAHQLNQSQFGHVTQQSAGFVTPEKAPAGVSHSGGPQIVQAGVDAGGDTVVLPGAPAGAAKKTRTNWSVYEGDMLIAVMKIHEDALLDPSTGIKYRTMSAAEKFTMISERLAQLDPPVYRTISQIEDKWDRMTSDFKKVYDWDKQPPSGKPSYWNMPQEMKRDQKMPPAFTKALFDRQVLLAVPILSLAASCNLRLTVILCAAFFNVHRISYCFTE
ncbi:hypothetical protein KFL_017880010 [Klebsormidium nitens]|uniref:Myb/SANT-like DNA-binding domain-containing protein n=1 Tax=Klebsormidium nitens TaxID=105231 RepID=A0A1Y1IVL0_KLENI|nr:hypothetical protein KFL_017880010 [Klebsormidium nitens]|eukprot:GAQ93669.1 hypothetical protein KFL_017880010 [Klebsormidium nitens]